jgi:hypothetical protein
MLKGLTDHSCLEVSTLCHFPTTTFKLLLCLMSGSGMVVICGVSRGSTPVCKQYLVQGILQIMK